jgi:ATP/ADP translocase
MSQSSPRPRISLQASVTASMLAAFALIAQQVVGKATRDTLFLSNYAAESLPLVMMASSLVSMLSVLALSRMLSVHSPARVMPVAVGLSSALLLAEWGLSAMLPRAAAVLVYLHMALFGAPLLSGFWSLINESFDPYTAKRAVGRIGMGASIGGVIGGLVALAVSTLVPVSSLLALMALLNVLALVGLVRLRRRQGGAPEPRATEPPASPLAGLRLLREVRYLHHLALIVALAAFSEALLDYIIKKTAATRFPSDHELMLFFAAFHTVAGILALITQSLLVRRSLETLGVASTVAVQPLLVALGGVAGALFPGLVSATGVRIAGAVSFNSLFRSGYELLFTPLPEQKKRPSKSIIDVGFDKLGGLSGAVVALTAIALTTPTGALRLLFAAAAVAAIAALLLGQRLHRGYIGALEDSLRTGAGRVEAADALGSTTQLTVAETGLVLERGTLLREIQARRGEAVTAPPASTAAPDDVDPLIRRATTLCSHDPAAIRSALLDTLDPRLVALVIPLLARNDVYLEAVRALRRVAPRVTGQLVDALLDPDQEPSVRRRLPRVLKACTSQRTADGLLLGLELPAFAVRQQCGVALARIVERNPAVWIPEQLVFQVVRHELQALRDPAAETERGVEHIFNLLALTLEREPLRISYWAVRSGDTLRGTALEYLENVLPDEIREGLWPLLGLGKQRSSSGRSRQEVADELLRSGSFSLPYLKKRRARGHER